MFHQPLSQAIFCEHGHAHKRIVPAEARVYENPEGLLSSKRNRHWSVDAWLHACNLAIAPAACRLLPHSSCDHRACVLVARTTEEIRNREALTDLSAHGPVNPPAPSSLVLKQQDRTARCKLGIQSRPNLRA